MLYDTTLAFWLRVLLRPATALVSGWLLLQGLHLFAGLSALRGKYFRWLRPAILILIALYLVVMGPFLLRIAAIPTFWVRTALFILGALLPGQLGGGYVFAFFLFGAGLWLFRPAAQK